MSRILKLSQKLVFNMKLVIFAIAIAQLGQLTADAVDYVDRTGELAPDFTLPIWEGSENVSLSDYEGHIIVLDFFYWSCAPCQTSMPDIEENVQKYFRERGGNADGIPVQVISLNILDQPDGTNALIESSGTELVLDDTSNAIQSYYSRGGIPLFVIINGVADSPSHQQWEILHHDSGYYGSTYFRNVINGVEAPLVSSDSPPIFLQQPPAFKIREIGGSITVQTVGLATGAYTTTWKRVRDGLVVGSGLTLNLQNLSPSDAGEYVAVLANENGETVSNTFELFVTLPAPSRVRGSFSAVGLPLPIPDNWGGAVSNQLEEFPLVVSGSTLGTVSELSINLNISHDYIGDLTIYLMSPSYKIINIRSYRDGEDDDIIMINAPVVGFAGENIVGKWKLLIGDNKEGDQGILNSWSLHFLEPQFSFSEWAVEHGYPADVDPEQRLNTGTSLLQQYALGDSGSSFQVEPKGTGVEVSFNSPGSVGADVQYLIESSTNLSDWSVVNYTGMEDLNDRMRCFVEVSNPAATSFYRLNLSLPPSE
ncbi:proprotein convertase P-domain-containing protein [Coraliomargarita sp. SDUM461004]|uniref:Proprotein convertase P-domain-containing protein n=1 Tax=Thalassobacterium sedimentorum TaxID=3041258 RepID=A0ABU1ALL7_9BACT|nr:proprotein convertase P-domain-containing protein [Coraliomargarita sp. SDUM461004]MDQ8195699.1 proprotein convertase P-domain-containing protein [Coraliomargarita sp. SDUM461004]